MQRLVDESASTFNARTDFFKTYTLPNHTTMLTGRPVLQVGDDPTLHHGYTRNGTPLPTATLHNSGNPAVDYISSVFDVFHDYGYSTALYTSKSKFVIYEQTYNETEFTPPGRSDQYLANGDQGPNKIDTYVYDRVGSSSTVLVDRFVSDMESDPYNYAFLHLRELDSIGHAQGWGTTPWEEGLEQIDEHLGKVFTLIDSNSNLRGNTAVIVTADHGGAVVRNQRGER